MVNSGTLAGAAGMDAGATTAIASMALTYDVLMFLADRNIRKAANSAQVELIEFSASMAEETMAHWDEYAPFENNIIAKVIGYPLYAVQYTARQSQFGNVIINSFNGNHEDYINWLADTCGESETICEALVWDNTRILQTIDARAYAMRFEEFVKFAEDAVRFSRQKSVSGMGRQLPSQIMRSIDLAAGIKQLNPVSLLGDAYRFLTYTPPKLPKPVPQPTPTAKYRINKPGQSRYPSLKVSDDTQVDLPAMSGEQYETGK